MTRRISRCVFHLFLAVTCFVSLASAQTASAKSGIATPSRIVQSVDDTVRMSLKGTTPKAIATAHDLGAVDGGRSLQRMVLVLKVSPEQQASLTRLIDAQHNKNSSDYRKWLTPEQFAAKFGPSDNDLAKVKGWLQSQGLNPTGLGRARQWIEFTGSVQQVNAAFRTSVHQFESNGQTHIANASDISIPAALTPVVSGVLSLNDFQKLPAHSKVIDVKRNAAGKLAPSDPSFTTTDGNGNYNFYLAPSDIHKIYNVSPLLADKIDGTGISIAIPGRSDVYLTDVQAFRQSFGLSQNDPNFIVNGIDPGISNSNDSGESSLDVEWAGAVAPGATINFVVSGSSDTTDGIDLSSAYIVDNAISPIVSVSYGLCEGLMGPAENQFYNALWEQAAAQGMTVFVSTGDVGAAQCDGDLQRNNYEAQGPALNGPSISGMSSTPYNVAVGGTQFNEASSYPTYWSANNDGTSESAFGYITEQAWNESCDPTLPASGTNCVYGQSSYTLEGGGGGPSNCSQSTVDGDGNVNCIGGYTKPSWQAGLGVPADGVRDTPDLSLNASPDDDGFLFCFMSSCETTTQNGKTLLEKASIVGGTSASAPSMAGIMALVEQKNGAFQGQANYTFYKLAAMDSGKSCDSSARTDPTQPSSCNFNDITMGSNSVPGLPGYGTSTAEWSAGPGYDMATGLGTVNATNLVSNWGNVTLTSSTTTLSGSGTTLKHGQPFNVAVSVKPANAGNAIPTGDVVFVTDKYGDVTQITLDATGSYSGPVSDLPGGTYNLTARYAGDGNFGSSVSAPIPVTVAPEDSSASIQFSTRDLQTNQLVPLSGSQQYGYPIAVSIKVTGKSGNGLATGTVNLLNGNKVVSTLPLNASGEAYFFTGYGSEYTFPVGANSVTVQYLGDSSFDPSTSAPVQVNVTQQQVYTGVGISWWQVPAGQPVLFTGSLVSLYSSMGMPEAIFPTIPTGTMQFYDNGTPIGSPLAIVDGGGFAKTTYFATLTTIGTHNITASYSGDSNYVVVSGTDPIYASSSEVDIVAPGSAATLTTIVQNPTAVTFGQSLTYTVTVTPLAKGGAVPTGQVVITGNGSLGGSANLVNGKGTLIEQQPGAGTSQVYAQYQGDSNYAASTSAVITTTIAKLNTQVSLTSTAPYVLSGQQTSLNFVVQGFVYGTGQSGYYNPQGTVQFFDAVNGGAPQAITAVLGMGPTVPAWTSGLSVRVKLPDGTNVITAQYSGDSYFNPATTAPVTLVVSTPDFLVSSDSSALTISAGGSSTAEFSVSPVLAFSGAVALSCSGLPSGTTCSFSPATVNAGGGQSTLTVTMQGPFTSAAANRRSGWWILSSSTGAFGILLIGLSGRRRMWLAALLLSIALFALMMGCGGSSHPPASTVAVVQSSQAKVPAGTAVTFTASIAGGSNGATGSVTFYDGATALGNAVTVANGLASAVVSNLSVGTHSITAKYSGDSAHAGSTSLPFYEAITGNTTLHVTANSGPLTHVVNFNLTVQ